MPNRTVYIFHFSGDGVVKRIPYAKWKRISAGGVIDLQHRKKKKAAADKYYWELNTRQIQAVIDCIW